MENYDHFTVKSRLAGLTSAGQWRAALESLMMENARCPSVKLEQQLVDLRLQAFRELSWPAPEGEWPPSHGVLSASEQQLPELTPAELTAESLRAGIMGNGAVIVRGLMARDTAGEMRDAIDRTMEARRKARQHHAEPDDAPWFTRSGEVAGGPSQFFAQGGAPVSASASVWTVDAPRTANRLIQFYHSLGLPAILHQYFGEPAALSVKKWVLRRVAPNNGAQAGWHQDGRFLGNGIRTVNMWIALSDCGGDAKAPGMEIIADGKTVIHETGTRGACFDWTVGQGLVDDLSRVSPVLCPRFQPGDALFFDHYNLHRTAFGEDHSEVRYALESWFFAASRAPAKQGPVFL